MHSEIARILEPESVAVVGASTDDTKRGSQIVETLQEKGYRGDVYPVNPNYGTIRGLDAYPAVSAIPDTVDLAVIAVPAQAVADVLESCGEKDVAGAVIIAAGFSEIGNEELEREIRGVATERGIRLIGPNIQGLVNPYADMDLVGWQDDLPLGDIALLSQSGNVGISVVTEAAQEGGSGFSFYITVGNETDVRFHEYLPYFSAHEHTGSVLMYVDGMADGRAFLEEASRFTTAKPIVVLKGGVTEAGKAAAYSHTASIAGSSEVIEPVYRQAGVTKVERLDELLPVTSALSSLPPTDGKRVGILSDGGGHATHAADFMSDEGLEVPDLTAETRTRLREMVPHAPNVTNPVDVVSGEDDLDVFYRASRVMLSDSNVDALLVTGIFGGYGSRFAGEYAEKECETARRLATLPDEFGKPLVVHSPYARGDSESLGVLTDEGVAVHRSVNVAVRCLSALAGYGEHLDTAHLKSDFVVPEGDATDPILAEAKRENREQLSEAEAKSLLDRSLPVLDFELATTAHEAVAAAAAFDGPVAMKVVSKSIVHKSDIGGVRLDVQGEAAVRNAYAELVENASRYRPEAELDGVLVSPMLGEGVELVVGMTTDEEVGKVMMFGVGGILVETLEDVAFRGLPLTEFDARSMLGDISARSILDGARGSPGVDEDALVEFLVKTSDLLVEHPLITELDLNPVFAHGDDVTVVDASIRL